MTLSIGKAYRLPNGEKGVYQGVDRYGHGFSTREIHTDILHICYAGEDEVTPWKEPRQWEDEVLVWEKQGGDDVGKIVKSFASLDYTPDGQYELVGRARVVVKEGDL